MSAEVTVKGFVKKLHTKSGVSAKGRKWTLYSARLVDEKGNEDPFWYSFGFDKPPFKSDEETDGHGDYIEIRATEKNGSSRDYVAGSGSIVKNAPARAAAAAAPASSGGGGGGGGYRREPTKSDLFGLIGGNYSEDDIRRITFSGARTDALELVKLLLEHKALPLTSASGRNAAAVRFEEINAFVDKLTVQYFFDTATVRLLTLVEDPRTGDGTSPVAGLPEDADEAEAEAEAGAQPDFDDDVPF